MLWRKLQSPNNHIFSVPSMTPRVVSQSIPSVIIPHPQATPGQIFKIPSSFLDTLCFGKFSTTFKISIVKPYPMNIDKFVDRTYIYAYQ